MLHCVLAELCCIPSQGRARLQSFRSAPPSQTLFTKRICQASSPYQALLRSLPLLSQRVLLLKHACQLQLQSRHSLLHALHGPSVTWQPADSMLERTS